MFVAVARHADVAEGIAAVGGAQDGAAEVGDAADLRRAERNDAVEARAGPRSRAGCRRTASRGGAPTSTTARMTAFRPGASPPPVEMAMRIGHFSPLSRWTAWRTSPGSAWRRGPSWRRPARRRPSPRTLRPRTGSGGPRRRGTPASAQPPNWRLGARSFRRRSTGWSHSLQLGLGMRRVPPGANRSCPVRGCQGDASGCDELLVSPPRGVSI